MLLTFSVLVFGLALAVFVYLFDNFMGRSDTPSVIATMAAMQSKDLPEEVSKPKRFGVAGV